MNEHGGDTLGLVRSMAESILASPKIKPHEQQNSKPKPLSFHRPIRIESKSLPQPPKPSAAEMPSARMSSVAPPTAELRDLKISDPEDDPHQSNSPYDELREEDEEDYDDDDDPEKTNPNLFIGDLSRTVTEEQLREFFVKYGEVLVVDIKRDKITQNNLGYGFVQFANRDDAIKAKEALHNSEIGGRKIRIGWAQKNTTLFVGDLDGAVTTQQLRTIFSKFGPLVEEETFVKAGSGKFGFVRFRHRGDAERAKAEMNRKVIGSRQCRIGWGDNNIQKHCVHVQFNPTQGAHLQEAQLKKHFESFGLVKSVSLPRFGNNRLKGYGFVHFTENSDGEKAAGKAIATIAETKIGSVTVRCSYGKRQIYNRYRRHPKHYKNFQTLGGSVVGPTQRMDGLYAPQPAWMSGMDGGEAAAAAARAAGGSVVAPTAQPHWSIPASPPYSPGLPPLGAQGPMMASPAFLYSPDLRGRSAVIDQSVFLPVSSQQSYYPQLYFAPQSAYAAFGSAMPSASDSPALYPQLSPQLGPSYPPSSPPLMPITFAKGYSQPLHVLSHAGPSAVSVAASHDSGSSGSSSSSASSSASSGSGSS